MNHLLFERFSRINSPVHGGVKHPSGVLDYSISVNPFKITQSVKDAYQDSLSSIVNYPDTLNTSLTTAVANVFGILEDRLLFTNGSAEAFSLIAGLILEPGKSAYIMSPCYSDYEHVSRMNGADVIVHQLDAARGFEPENEAVLNEIRSSKPELIWLCSPNNPTGVILDPEFIKAVARLSAKYGGFVVLDEAYSAFSMQGPQFLQNTMDCRNIITVRSMTKDFGVPGLRLGFISAVPELIHILDLYKPCWSVSTPAQAVGEALMSEMEYYRGCWKMVKSEQSSFIKGLVGCGINPSLASANDCGIFIFFKAPEISGTDSFVSAMAGDGVIVRDCESMGASGYCRIGVKSPDDNKRFIAVLRKVING